MIDQKWCVLIVEDDKRMQKALCDFLSRKNYETLCALDGDSALELFYKNGNTIDLILLDVMMPKRDGFSVLNELRSGSEIPVILLTARSEEKDQLSGFSIGADDYVVKPFSPALLLARIKSLLRRSGKGKKEPFKVGKLVVDSAKQEIALPDKNHVKLTPKEFELLQYFIINQGITLTREQILNAIWNFDYEGGGRTVDTHVKQLRAKLTAACPYIRTVHGIGYRFEVTK